MGSISARFGPKPPRKNKQARETSRAGLADL
jgi:hypothetical protein